MASSLCRKIHRSIFSTRHSFTNHHPSSLTSLHRFSSETSSDSDSGSGSDADSASTLHSEPVSDPLPKSSGFEGQRRFVGNRPLEQGLDSGIYKAILIGRVGQHAIEKKLKSGRTVTLLSVGTGGLRSNRRPLQNEEPRDYANRSMVQWHRVSIYPERLGALVVKHAVPGSILYLEGNLETKIFNDPVIGLARRIREIAVRQNGRIVFLGGGGDSQQPHHTEMKGVGYY